MISRNIESIFCLPDDGLIINKPFIEIPPYKHKVPETRCVVLLLGALVKIGNGAFLLYQKQFAAKYAPKKPKGDQ